MMSMYVLFSNLLFWLALLLDFNLLELVYNLFNYY